MDSSFWFDTKTRDGPLYISRGVSYTLKDLFTVTNSVDPDEMPHLLRNFIWVFFVFCIGGKN